MVKVNVSWKSYTLSDDNALKTAKSLLINFSNKEDMNKWLKSIKLDRIKVLSNEIEVEVTEDFDYNNKIIKKWSSWVVYL